MFKNAVRKKSAASTMVAMKTIFSTPRRVRYTLPSPPNIVERPPPRCCIKILITRRMETMICVIFMIVRMEESRSYLEILFRYENLEFRVQTRGVPAKRDAPSPKNMKVEEGYWYSNPTRPECFAAKIQDLQ